MVCQKDHMRRRGSAPHGPRRRGLERADERRLVDDGGAVDADDAPVDDAVARLLDRRRLRVVDAVHLGLARVLIVVSLSQRSPAPAPRSQVLVDGDAERRVAGEFNVLAHGPAVRRVLGHDAGRGAVVRLVSCRCRSSSQGAHPLLEHAMSTSSRVGASEMK